MCVALFPILPSPDKCITIKVCAVSSFWFSYSFDYIFILQAKKLQTKTTTIASSYSYKISGNHKPVTIGAAFVGVLLDLWLLLLLSL